MTLAFHSFLIELRWQPMHTCKEIAVLSQISVWESYVYNFYHKCVV